MAKPKDHSRTPGAAHSPRTKLRCAVYTRKSSEEGLEQAFNSLDAQREACEAYVTSQRHEGWSVLPEMYDDGGISGGTMERPALKRLLAEVAAGQIDVVVVYKVDRLTRSLGDFARIVELFDKHGVSFVSVTQAFNTTTSMGRLTLNVLLSFAQFEREVTGERIRDKIAASKKKGLWMGGQPPLGYDVRDRKLVVNEAEATTVRRIFARYVELRSVRELKAELDALGIVSKARRARDGSPYGAQPLARGALYHMLANRLYRGMIVHKGTCHAGEHAAIVDAQLFDEVQGVLAGNRVERTLGTRSADPSLLMGLAYDANGERLTPTHATKAGTRYRYYVSRPLTVGSRTDATAGQRLPAAALEGLVRARVGELLADGADLLEALSPCPAEEQQRILAAAGQRSALWLALTTLDIRAALLAFVARIDVHSDRIGIAIDTRKLAGWLADDQEPPALGQATDEPVWHPDHATILLTVPVHLKRRGNELRLVVEGASDDTPPNVGLMRLVARAHAVAKRLHEDRASIEDVAGEEGITPLLCHPPDPYQLPGTRHHRPADRRRPSSRPLGSPVDGRNPVPARLGRATPDAHLRLRRSARRSDHSHR